MADETSTPENEPAPAAEIATEQSAAQSASDVYRSMMEMGDEEEQIEPAAEEVPDGPELDEADEEAAEAEAADDAADQPDGEGEEAQEEVEAAESVDAPSEVPLEIKRHWSKLPPEVRDKYLAERREMNVRLSDMGREAQQLAPIKEALRTAIAKLPVMANMTPKQVADETFQLAQLAQGFQSNPIQTMMGLMQRHGLVEPMKQILTQNQAPDQTSTEVSRLIQQNRELQARLEQVSDPNFVRQHFDQFRQEDRLAEEISALEKLEHYEELADYLPDMVRVAKTKLGPGASHKDVLQTAYDMAAREFLPASDARPASKPAPTKGPEQEAAKRKKAEKARNINRKSQNSGDAAPLTDTEAARQIYRKMMQ